MRMALGRSGIDKERKPYLRGSNSGQYLPLYNVYYEAYNFESSLVTVFL